MDYVSNNILLAKEYRKEKAATIFAYDRTGAAEKMKKEGSKQHA